MDIDEYKDDDFEIPFEVNVGFKDGHANFYDILYIKTSELSSFDFDAYTKKVVESVS